MYLSHTTNTWHSFDVKWNKTFTVVLPFKYALIIANACLQALVATNAMTSSGADSRVRYVFCVHHQCLYFAERKVPSLMDSRTGRCQAQKYSP